MNEITIPFNAWSIERLNAGRKCATSRNKVYGRVGDVFKPDNGKSYKIEYIISLALGVVRDYLYLIEGANSPEEFEEVWTSIHPKKGFDKEQLVWVHFFKEVKE